MLFFLRLCSLLIGLIALPASAQSRNIVQEMIDAINQTRYQNGLGQLYVSDSLMRSAFFHARDMAERNYFNHYTPEGWSAEMRANGQGYPSFLMLRENIGAGIYEPWQMVGSWMNSQGHRGNILAPYARDIGVAHYYRGSAPYRNYWVLLVGAG